MPEHTSVKLPDHPGDLIRLAVLDLVETASDTKHFKIDMGVWFWPDIASGVCEVCMAGAVMAQTLHANRRYSYRPWQYKDDTERKLRALDNFRCGNIALGYHVLFRDQPESLPSREDVTPWSTDPDLFLSDMLDLASMIDDAEGKNG
jgi:hypothetical protein